MFATAVRTERDLGVPVRLLECPDRASLLRPGGLRRATAYLAAGAGAGYRCPSGGRSLAPSGDWDSGNPAFAISRGSPGAPPLTPGHGHRFPGMLFSHASFRIPVSHQIQRYLLPSLPAARAIQHCTSWRTRSVKPSASPPLFRTQHLPPPAETARGLGIPGLAGCLAVVPLCVMVCRCEPLHSSGYGHMADGIGPEQAVHQTACFWLRCPIVLGEESVRSLTITDPLTVWPTHGPRDQRAVRSQTPHGLRRASILRVQIARASC